MSKRLDELDLKEVSQRTQIEIDFLDSIVKKNYKRLERFNVKGFIKILNREYEDLDLSEFIEEYNKFLEGGDEEKKEKSEEKASQPKINTAKQDAKKLNIVAQDVEHGAKEYSNSWLWILILIVCFAIAWVVYQYDLIKFVVNDEQQQQNLSTSVVEIIDEAQNNVKDSSDEKDETNEVNETKPEETEQATQDKEENATTQEENQEQKQGLNQQEQINSILSSDNTNTPKIQGEAKEAIFSTEGKVWVGFIDLTTRAKTATVTDNNFTIDLSKDQLLLIGATALTLVDDTGTEQKFPAGSSKRFLVKDGKIKSISLTEFMSYNKGREW